MERRVIEIYGRSEDLDKFEDLCRHIEYLGNIGASRNLLVRVDGDGNGRMQFKKHGERINNHEYSTDQETTQTTISGTYDIGG